MSVEKVTLKAKLCEPITSHRKTLSCSGATGLIWLTKAAFIGNFLKNNQFDNPHEGITEYVAKKSYMCKKK